MGFKVTQTALPETTPNEPKTRKGMKNQLWLTDSAKYDDQTVKRPETSISRQFLPKKKHGISEAWTKKIQESREDLKQPFPYTPFKSGSLSGKTSVKILRDAALNSQLNQDFSQIYGVQQQQVHPRTMSSMQGTIRNPANGSYDASVTPRPEVKEMWKVPQTGMIPPPPGSYRPTSAMNMSALSRPASRANSDLGIGTVAFCDGMGNAPSRYQSYCTLPRPEQIDFEQHSNYASEINQMAKQINQIYGPYNPQIQASINSNPMSKQNILSNNRPVSSMLVGAPGMASDYLNQQQAMYGPIESNVIPQITDDEVLKPAKEIVNFDALSVLSVLQVLCSLVIFGCGILRIIWNLKWAVGIELIFAALVFISGIAGIYANCRRSYCAATASFILSVLNSILSFIPLILGVLPAIANAFPTLNSDWLLDLNEALAIDYLLSFTCFVEMVTAVITSIYGCKALGLTMRFVEKLRFSVDLNAIFENIASVNQKGLDRINNKGSMQ